MILPPVRCFTCGAVIGHRWKEYEELKAKKGAKAALDEMGITRYCCRRMFISTVINEELKQFRR
jgi:DNA-directed RNA polymerase subunit N